MNTKILLGTGCLLATLSLALHPGQAKSTKLTGPYLGQKPPGKVPELFAPGIISTEFHEHSFPSFSPDGNHVLFTRAFVSNYIYKFPVRILSLKNDNGWSFPEFADFISLEETSEAYFSPDGARIYYSVHDEIQNNPDGKKSFDIWYVEKAKPTWSAPIRLGKAINTEKNELQATVTKNLTLYYLGHYEKGKNNYGIYRSKFLDGNYTAPELLPDSINSGHTNWTPFIAPDESYLLFSSDRPGGYGSGDIFVSFRREDDTWTDPVNLGPPINSACNERYPYVSPDGKYLFFVSDKVNNALWMEKGHTYREYEQMYKSAGNGWSDVYWIEAGVIEERRPKGFPRLAGPYLGQKPPGRAPEVFARGIISFPRTKEFACAFSPDGKEFYYTSTGKEDDRTTVGTTQRIMYSKIEEGCWSKPRPAEFSKGFFAHEPHVAFDNQRIFWYWANKDNPGVYYAERNQDGWSKTIFAGPGEFVSSTRDGRIFVGDPRGDSWWQVSLAGGRSAKYEALPDLIKELRPIFSRIGHPCIAPDGAYVVFDAAGGHHLFVSFKSNDGTWSRPVDLTEKGFLVDDGITSISPDGKYLFFQRNNDIYWVDARIIEELRPKE